jgi:diguanylate cyclase (GGDEF)-like protein
MDSARRGGHEAAVIMLDIDNFKELNDDLGHTAGDQALAEISTVLAHQTRASDMAVRWGGDEFLVVLRLPAATDAAGAVERIRSQAEQALRDRFTDREGLGVTAGFAVSPSGSVDIDELIAAADAALIDGKWVKKGVTYGV